MIVGGFQFKGLEVPHEKDGIEGQHEELTYLTIWILRQQRRGTSANTFPAESVSYWHS